MTYTTLKTAIAENMHRTDLTTKIPDFIALAEAFLFRELNIRDLETSTTGTTTGGLYHASSGLRLPCQSDNHLRRARVHA